MEKNRPLSRIEPRTTGSLLYECIGLCAGEGLRPSCPHLYPAWPSAPSTNCWKPDIEMLEVLYGKNRPLSVIESRTTGSLGGCCGAPSFQHPGLLLHCCWPYAQSSHFTVLPCLYDCIALCAGEGLMTPMSPTLPSLAFCPKPVKSTRFISTLAGKLKVNIRAKYCKAYH